MHGRVTRIEVNVPVAFVLPNATGRSRRLMHSCFQVEASLVETSPVNKPLGMGLSEAYSQTAWRPVKPLVRANFRKAVNKPQCVCVFSGCVRGELQKGVPGLANTARMRPKRRLKPNDQIAPR